NAAICRLPGWHSLSVLTTIDTVEAATTARTTRKVRRIIYEMRYGISEINLKGDSRKTACFYVFCADDDHLKTTFQQMSFAMPADCQQASNLTRTIPGIL
ncbi:hypothetical protein F4604DRAFT_1717266, partial [Suillus subluteus]